VFCSVWGYEYALGEYREAGQAVHASGPTCWSAHPAALASAGGALRRGRAASGARARRGCVCIARWEDEGTWRAMLPCSTGSERDAGGWERAGNEDDAGVDGGIRLPMQ
jgi:hypothetical protein